MKITLVRLSVLALAFTGFAAASVTSSAASKHVVNVHASSQVVSMPGGGCQYNDPNHCGM